MSSAALVLNKNVKTQTLANDVGCGFEHWPSCSVSGVKFTMACTALPNQSADGSACEAACTPGALCSAAMDVRRDNGASFRCTADTCSPQCCPEGQCR